MVVLFLSACKVYRTNAYISFCILGGAKVTWNYSLGSEGCLRNYTRGNALVCSNFNNNQYYFFCLKKLRSLYFRHLGASFFFESHISKFTMRSALFYFIFL